MAMTTVGPFCWPPVFTIVSTGFGNLLVDAASEVAAAIFEIKKSGTITRIVFRTGTTTSGGANDLDLRLETVNTSGEPSGTLWATNTNINHDLANADDNQWNRSNTLTASATVAVGDLIAAVVANPAASFGNFNVSSTTAIWSTSPGLPVMFNPDRTTQAGGTSGPCIAIEYDDGTFALPQLTYPSQTAATAVNLTTASNPDEVAMYFTPQAKMRVIGWHAILNLAAGADYRVNLYQDGNNTPLLTADYDGDLIDTASTTRGASGYFSSTSTLAAGTVYRLGILPTTANQVAVRYVESPSSFGGAGGGTPLNMLDECPGKQAMHYSARDRSGTTDPDTAAWSQTTNRRLLANLICDQIDDGAGGAGGMIVHPGMAGGMRA